MITNDVQLCIDALGRGELVAFPTETVFGLGARSDSPVAVNKIFELKERPADHPLITHCADIDVALGVSQDLPEYARALASEFWPGPMTLIFNRDGLDAICDEAVGGHDTVAMRVPSHDIALELLEACDFFVSAPSANKFGRVSPTTAQHVQSEFGNDLLILDGTQSEIGLESTIISCVNTSPMILRAGAITAQDILRVTGFDVIDETISLGEDRVAAPGSLEIHYAPLIPVVVLADQSEVNVHDNFDTSKCALLAFSEPSLDFAISLVVGDYEEYAYEMYSFFRNAEKSGCEAIFAVAPDEVGMGVAINDRLKRAANAVHPVRLK